MDREKKNKLPEFQSLEEEKEYWEARGPLAEGSKGRMNKPRSGQKRSSFLSVRLTGEEIVALREVAAIFYTKPSEFARGAILDSVKRFKSLHERDQKEQGNLEEALRYGLTRPSLSERELKILHMIADGVTIKEITSQLFLSQASVKRSVRLIFEKLGVRNRSEHERDQKERKSLEEALRYGLTQPSTEPLDLRSRTSDATLEDVRLYWKRIIEENPKMALYHTALLILENLIGGSDKSISISIEELDNRLSHPERVTK